MCPDRGELALRGERLALQQTLYQSRNPTRRWLHCSRRDWILARIAHYGVSVHRALEVGSGCGVYLPALASVAEALTVADIDVAYLDSARSLLADYPAVHCVEDDITRTQLPQGSFDLVLCSEVIEHIGDSAAALRALSRLLTREGVLVLTTPQRFSPLELCAKVAFLPGVIQLVRWLYQEPVLATGHINLLTRRQLQRQLRAAGLDVVETHLSGLYLPLVAEFGGRWGQRLLQWCEAKLRRSRLSWLLWTQYYVLRRARQPRSDPAQRV